MSRDSHPQRLVGASKDDHDLQRVSRRQQEGMLRTQPIFECCSVVVAANVTRVVPPPTFFAGGEDAESKFVRGACSSAVDAHGEPVGAAWATTEVHAASTHPE